MTQNELYELQKKVDVFLDNQDKEQILKVISELENEIDSITDLHIRTNFYYILGNCYKEIHDIKISKNSNLIWDYDHKELFKSIYYFRKSINEKNFEDFEVQLKIGLLTNLANSFSHYGRPIEAIRYLNMALFEHKKEQMINEKNILYPNYYVLLVNKGICLEHYSKLLYDVSHTHLFNKEAYKNFMKVVEEIDLIIEKLNYDFYKNLKNDTLFKCNNLEKVYGLEFLEKDEDYNNYILSENKSEEEYKRWCLDNKLYLNPMNDLGNFNIASHDILNLPSLKTQISDGFPIFITYFNQIKQEFIFNRSLLFEGLNNKTSKFYDNETNIINDFDYNLYNMNIEKIKIVFRGLYGLFDKIAYLLNEYLDLGRGDRDIDFNKIWKKPKSKEELHSKILKSNNYALRGLYLLSRDINFNINEENEFNMSLEPHSKNVAKIRNHLEHKFLMVKIINPIGENDRKRKYYQIKEDELIKETIRLCQLVREAIIYTSLAIFFEEEKKNNKEEVYVEQELDIY